MWYIIHNKFQTKLKTIFGDDSPNPKHHSNSPLGGYVNAIYEKTKFRCETWCLREEINRDKPSLKDKTILSLSKPGSSFEVEVMPLHLVVPINIDPLTKHKQHGVYTNLSYLAVSETGGIYMYLPCAQFVAIFNNYSYDTSL